MKPTDGLKKQTNVAPKPLHVQGKTKENGKKPAQMNVSPPLTGNEEGTDIVSGNLQGGVMPPV